MVRRWMDAANKSKLENLIYKFMHTHMHYMNVHTQKTSKSEAKKVLRRRGGV